MKDTNIINVRFSRKELTDLDTLVERGGFKSRSALLKALIDERMCGVPSDETKNAVLEVMRNDEEVRQEFKTIAQEMIQNIFESLMHKPPKSL